MNGAERVFAEILAWRPGLREFDLWRFLGVTRSQVSRWRVMDNMSDGALLVVHDRTGIPVRKLLGLRACTRQPATGKKPKRRGQPVAVQDQQRERFEQWAMVDNRYTRRDGDSYYDPVVAICWKAWKAALDQP